MSLKPEYKTLIETNPYLAMLTYKGQEANFWEVFQYWLDSIFDDSFYDNCADLAFDGLGEDSVYKKENICILYDNWEWSFTIVFGGQKFKKNLDTDGDIVDGVQEFKTWLYQNIMSRVYFILFNSYSVQTKEESICPFKQMIMDF